MREVILFALFFGILAVVALRLRASAGVRTAVALISAVAVTSLLGHSWVEVPPGYVGAVYDPFGGGIQNRDLREGWHLISPWASLQPWIIRTQEYTMSATPDEGAVAGDDAMTCQTSEGLQVKIDATVLFRIDPGNAHRLWKSVGALYIDKIVRTGAREAVRSVVSQYPIMAVYSNATPATVSKHEATSYPGKRQEVEDAIRSALAPAFAAKGIQLEGFLLRNVAYVSESFENAIVSKQVAQQQVLTQQFLLDIERIKAQQKVVQSEGQAEAIRLRGAALRASQGVIGYEFVRQLPLDLDITVLPGGGNMLLNLPSGTAAGGVSQPERGRDAR
jgi:regulator of protease activity HflC (stomatin/prohibitin superfamily)